MGNLLALVDVRAMAFFALAGLTVGSAGIVALSRNIIYATVALLGTFLGIAGLYITLSADFLGATQVLVYVGGTLTLILFAVMLTARIEDVRVSNSSFNLPVAAVLVVFVLAILGKVATGTEWPVSPGPEIPSTARLGHAFLSEYLLPFWLASVVLLAALVGAVVLARRAVKREWEEI